MANIKQQKKRIFTDQKHKLRNQMFKSRIRTALKKSEQAISEGTAQAKTLVAQTVKLLDKAKTKKIKKANFVNRQKSKIMQKLAAITKKATE